MNIKKLFFTLVLISPIAIMADEIIRANSISCSSGSLEIDGGLAVAGNLNVNGIITASGRRERESPAILFL